MADSTFLSLSLCFLVFLHGCFAQIEPVTTQPRGFPPQQRQQRPQRDECQLDRISAVEPNRRIQSEAGVTDVWDENDDQFQCAGVVAMRHVIQEKGLLLPQYVNGPKLVYVVQGRGVQGVVFPGCPETFQSSESQSHSQYGQSGRQSQRDQHQKVRQIREGDVLALPTGVAQWVYNDGRNPLVLVQVIDTNNPANQLDQNHRVFFVAGNPQQDIQSQKGEFGSGERSESSQRRRPAERARSGNVFTGMDERVLAEAFNVNTDLARRLRGEDDYRGMIVRVERGLEVISPQRSPEEEREIREQQQQKQLERESSRESGRFNGVEETFCTARLRHNANNPSDADIFNPRAGRVTNVNSHNLPILRNLQLSVQRVVLYRDAIFAPHWNVNAHCICYITRGSGHVQIVDDNGNTVFDGQVQEGQMITAPQNFVVVKKASVQGMEWVSFKTNDAAKISQLAGRVSALRSMPVEVVANAFQVSMEDARRLKENRQEVTLLSPWSRSRFNATEGSE
ncbi:hypothetical protein P3X46_006297 [Hevea brasiliensis]|uniref:Cupin type-1 domain-containing protein n=1 Tax=Hevea brasiliensis TaxID=3981 RepID=A0ABQ9MPR9_HEVBR|nr:11S globulin seed storage protein Jug r 4-like [Hevea brasiliensis]KAJ9182282.1 hypothetical protein P3X46_006297 [Hevea brasiliensis]